MAVPFPVAERVTDEKLLFADPRFIPVAIRSPLNYVLLCQRTQWTRF